MFFQHRCTAARGRFSKVCKVVLITLRIRRKRGPYFVADMPPLTLLYYAPTPNRWEH